MLPERLSNDLCSLVPDQDRAAFTAILSFDADGRRIGQRYGRSLIRSHRRFTYTTVHQLTYLRDPEVRRTHAGLAPMLDHARHLAALLKKRRVERGSLEFNLPEAEVRLDGDQVAELHLGARNEAHLLVEDFMLAANEAVAESLSRAGRAVLYRIHEYPDLTKLETFTEAARAMGLQLPKAPINPAWFARVLAQAKATSSEYVVNTLLLRTMQQARYSPENAGHFGLAADFYLHFTSPIRRYPDLVAHRVLQAQLSGEAAATSRLPFPARESSFVEAGVHLSQCERKAIEVERNVHARLSVLFLFDRVGETFTAIISGVTTFGLFVALEDVFVSGSVPLKTMTDDYYLFDGRRFRLVGESSNRIYQLGQRVEVRLEQADLATRRLTFALLGEAAPAAVAGTTS
jgi:ribonuclease R